MNVNPSAFRVVSGIFIGIAMRYPEITLPTDGVLNESHWRDVALEDVRAIATRGGYLSTELVDEARKVELDITTGGNPIPTTCHTLAIDFNPRTNRICYVVPGIGEPNGATLPTRVPRDMVSLLDAREHSTSNTVRLLGQIARIYRDALDCPNITANARYEVIQSLRLLFSMFCATVCSARLKGGDDPEQGGDANPNPTNNVHPTPPIDNP